MTFRKRKVEFRTLSRMNAADSIAVHADRVSTDCLSGRVATIVLKTRHFRVSDTSCRNATHQRWPA
jgi:hypothetical protein